MDFNIMSADEVNNLFKDVPDESTDGNIDQTKDDSTVEVKALFTPIAYPLKLYSTQLEGNIISVFLPLFFLSYSVK